MKKNQGICFVVCALIAFIQIIVCAPRTKVLNGGKEEHVVFYALEGRNSLYKIPRRGILVRRPQARATILICHGFMCSKFDIRFLRMMFPEYNTFLFDFRAHGENPGRQVCTLGKDEAYDVKGAVDFIKSDPELKKLPLFVYGFSMGAASSIEAQAKDPSLFDAAVWDCPFDSTENIIARGIEDLKISLFGYEFAVPGRRFLQRHAYNPYVQAILKFALKTIARMDATQINTRVVSVRPMESIRSVTIPCFFISCINDEKSPAHAVRSVYDGARGFKRLWITNGRRHYDSFFYNPEEYSYKVRRFFEKVLAGNLSKKVQQKITEDPREPHICF